MFVSRPTEVPLDPEVVGTQAGGGKHVATIAPLGYKPLERILLASLATDAIKRRALVERPDPDQPWQSSREAFRQQRERFDKPAFLVAAIRSWTFDRLPTAAAFNDIEDARQIDYLYDVVWDVSFPPAEDAPDSP